jgi:hypothetical protein
MKDALPAFVLDPEPAKRSAMPIPVAVPIVRNDALENPEAERSASADSDEQLMLAFSGGSAEAFAELFSRYKHLCSDFSAAGLPIRPRQKN